MGEASGSRYNIIKELTDKKLSLLDKKQRVQSRISDLIMDLKMAQQSFVAWDKTVELEKQTKEQEFKHEIERIREQIEQEQKAVEQKEKSIEKQINEINKGLESIKEISKESSGGKE